MKHKKIKLGVYNGTPIEWLVLDETEDKYLLLSKYILELRRFDEDSNDYGESEIKDFLENYMLPRIGIFDNLFLLSIEEVEKYLPEEKDRIAFLEPIKYGKDISYWWWLRSPNCDYDDSAYYVYYNGCIYSGGGVNSTNYGVRPACWVKKEYK